MRNQVQREKKVDVQKNELLNTALVNRRDNSSHKAQLRVTRPVLQQFNQLSHPPVANCPLANSLPLPSPQKSVQGKCFHSHQYAQNVFQELIKSQSTDIFLYYEDKCTYFLLATRC